LYGKVLFMFSIRFRLLFSLLALCGLQVGDEPVSVDGKPLTANLSEQVKKQISGRANAVFPLKIRRGSKERVIVLTLAPRPGNS
jgi:C-terminal processing protease CtpA/Prc